MKPSFEKLVPTVGESFRCFNRKELKTEVKWHRHPEFEINFVEKGKGTRIVGDHISEFSDGDLVLLGSNLPHTWLSDDYVGKRFDRHPSFVVQFSPKMVGGSFLGLPEFDAVRQMLGRSRRGIWFRGKQAKKVGELMVQLVRKTGAARFIGLLECLNELTSVQDTILLATDEYSLVESHDSDSRIQTVCQFINSNYTNSLLDVGQLPDLVGMNPSAFSRFFKKTTGRTVTQFVNELRIGLACRKLADTKLSILEISLQVGFGNLSNFNRRFRVTKGMTPTEYRNLATYATDRQ